MKPKQECPRCGKELPADAPEGVCPACLAAAYMKTGLPWSDRVEPMPVEEVGALFPELEVLGLLGSGGMGAVYKARQPKLGRLVALKILDRHDGDPRFVERFTREAQTLARLSHPSIVTVYEFGEREGLPFLIMELVDGVTLRSLLRAGKMPPEQALAIVPPICEALQYAHDKGVIHRDIKPENILVDKEGRVKVADFGIARLMEGDGTREHLTGDAERVGTAHYMAPEQVERPAEVDHRADIYALGVVFYEMLTGELPLGKFPQPSKRVEVDVRLDEVVLKALEKEPEQRYQQASEVKTAVTMLSTDSTVENVTDHTEWKNPNNWTGPKWLSVYFSKRDSRIWVPKQIPDLGWTINLGRSGGVALLFIVILGLALLALLIGYYVTSSGDRVDGAVLSAVTPEDDRNGEVVAQAPFIARLPEGSIELLAVSNHPSDDQPRWRPDGSEYDGPPVYTWGGSSHPYGDELPREFVFRRGDVPDGADIRIAFDPPSSQAGNLAGFEPGVPDYGLNAVAASLSTVTDTVTVKVGVGSGPWRMVSETRAGSGASGTTEGDWSVAFASQTEIDGSARVTVAHNIEGHSIRMVAVDVNDQVHASTLSGIGTSGFSAQNATFRGLPLEDVARFEFQVRPYAWAEFRNVSLEPGRQTLVEVVHAPAAGDLALTDGPGEALSEFARMEERMVSVDEPVRGSASATPERSESSIQGQWQIVAAYENGEAASLAESDYTDIHHILADRIVVFNVQVNEITEEISYVVNPNVEPAWIDFIDGDDTIKAIYRIEDDKLTICRPEIGDERRSTAFVSERDPDSPNRTLLEFRRIGPLTEGFGRFTTESRFVVPVPRRMGTEVLDAFRAFIHEHRWRMVSESGDDEHVVLRATDPAGNSITARLDVVGRSDGQFSLTVETAPGAELSAQRIGFAICTRVGLRFPGEEPDGAATAGSGSDVRPREWGDVIERVVNDDGVGRDFFIDLDTGRLLSPPVGLNPDNQDAVLQWVEMEGVDAMGETGASVRGLVGYGMKVRPIASERWATISAEEVDADAALRGTVAGTYAFMSAKGEMPETFLIETRDGRRGILQITGFSDEPRGVVIRYKLVLETSSSSVSESVETVARAFLEALRNDDLAAATSLIATSSPLVATALPRNAESLRTAYNASPDRLTQITEMVIEGDWAAVRGAGPTISPMHGLHLILHRTDGAWRIASFDDASEHTPLKTYLDRGMRRAIPPTQGSNAGAIPRAYQTGSVVVDTFLESCAASGVTNRQQMFAALGMEPFLATYGNGESAMREHHDKLPPIMQAAILRTSGDPSPEFFDYIHATHLREGAKLKPQALLLLEILGVYHDPANDKPVHREAADNQAEIVVPIDLGSSVSPSPNDQ